MTCSNCGSEHAADARFCGSCGQPVRTHADERRVVTVVFADIVGFTTLSENLDPERVKRLVDVAFERLVHDVHEFGGRVDKIIGDAIVALFGAPVAHEDDAERAVRAALRMQETLAAYATESSVGIRMRIGVNTGEVLVGALRAGGDYTAMGDVVNTASRLETSANPGEVLVGATTHAATRDVIGYESRGSMLVRGREAPVEVWAATEALVPPGYRPRRITPLVGRDTELGILRNLVDLSISHRRGQMIVLLGEAGVGKTRLANEIAPLVLGIDPTTAVLNGRCVPYGEANPWWPIAEALRESCSIDIDDDLDVARYKCTQAVEFVVADPTQVGGVVTGLLHLMGYDGPLRALEASRAKGEASSALLTYMEAGVRVRPVVIRLADLHWADPQVLELIDHMAERMARQPFVLVATARRALLERWSPRAGRQNSLVMNLDPLGRDAAGELLDALLSADVGEDVRSMLLDRSGGNPFYLEELATLLGNREASAPDGASPEVPDTLRGLIAARIDGLTAEEQMVLEDASVWGASGPTMALREIGRAVRGSTDVDALVASLATKDIFVLDADGDEWSFRSDIVREIAYTRLTKAERLRRHHGIAKYLEAAAGGRFIDDSFVDTVSRHFAEAARLARELGRTPDTEHLDERAIRWLGEAARRADQAASWPLAARLYDQVLDLASGDHESHERLVFLLGRGHARNEMWNFAGARTDAEEAAALVAATDDQIGAARLELLLGEIASREGDFAAAAGHFDAAVCRFADLGDDQSRAEALRQKGMAALFRNDAAAAEEPIARSLDAFRVVGDRRGEAWALQNLAWIAFVTGRVGEAELRLNESFAAFTEIADHSGLAWTEGLLAFVRMSQGRMAEAGELADRILHESERRNDRWAQAMMLLVLGSIDLWEGRTERATTVADRSVAHFVALGDPTGLQQGRALAGRAHMMLGNVEDGLAMVEQALEGLTAHTIGPQTMFAVTSSIAARVQLGAAQRLELDVLRRIVEDCPDGQRPADLVAGVGLALAQAGDPKLGAEILALDETSLGEEVNVAGPVSGYRSSASALVAAALGRHDAAHATAADVASGSTYLDRAFAHVAVGLGRGFGWLGEFAAALAEVDGSGDRVTRATIELARAHAAEAAGHDAALLWRDEAEASWSELGVDPGGWRSLFSAACATVPAGR
ncbi:MAG: adenylate/guanylate cyclase domain-containing protein [Acidimicrobiales bacterium]